MGSLVKRAQFVRDRIVTLHKAASEIVLETGVLLQEYKSQGYFLEQGYDSFDSAIEDWQSKGLVDFGPRNARNFIAIVNMVQARGLKVDDVKEMPVSKLREIASIPIAEEQARLLEAAKTMTTAEVQREAKQLRDKAHGRESDPLHPITLMTTESGREHFRNCIKTARTVYALSDDMPETAVLIDHILADWYTNAIEHLKEPCTNLEAA